jgi:dTDP-glucose 4,6-dehydratase
MNSTLSPRDLAFMADPLTPLQPLLEGRNILLTGGTGHFGKWLLESYVQLRRVRPFFGSVTVLSRHPETFLARNPFFAQFDFFRFVAGDVREAEFPAGSRFDFVIHAATEASAKLEKEDPDEMYSVIVDGTDRVLTQAQNFGVKRFLFVSSGAVYGPQPPEVENVPETFPCAPVTAYGRGKLEAEKMTLDAAAAAGFEAVLARCFAFVGPYRNLDIHFAAGNFLRNALNCEPILIKGDGTPFRSYLYTAELAVWLWTLLLRGRSGEAYNVGAPTPVSIRELAEAVSSCVPGGLPIRILGTPQPGARPARYVPDVTKIARELSLKPEITLHDALERTLEFASRTP